jgi:crossover junction endodeoxyribonuclease RuvC
VSGPRLVLGIDPGIATLGYGLVTLTPDGPRHVDHGCVLTRPPASLPERLQQLQEGLTAICARHSVTDVAMETLFLGRRVHAHGLGEARGVAVLTTTAGGAHFSEYGPSQVKQAVTGSGAAPKRQVQEMVRLILGLQVLPRPDDAADALAIALCHALQIDLQRLVAAEVSR